jgi:dolichol kinase
MNQASIVGRRLGTHRWSPTSSKTLEGSCAFVLSVLVAAELLRLLGVVEEFSVGADLESGTEKLIGW